MKDIIVPKVVSYKYHFCLLIQEGIFLVMIHFLVTIFNLLQNQKSVCNYWFYTNMREMIGFQILYTTLLKLKIHNHRHLFIKRKYFPLPPSLPLPQDSYPLFKLSNRTKELCCSKIRQKPPLMLLVISLFSNTFVCLN